MSLEHVDVLIVGAGLSGIGAGYHLQANCPGKSYAILEGRDSIGGTWDLFRYPGIRSDSDMYTLGYPSSRGGGQVDRRRAVDPRLRPQDGADNGIEQNIRFNHKVRRAEWSTAEGSWTVEAERTDTQETVRLSCGFLFMCSGYYSYDEGYTPDFEGSERFAGRIVHPQQWTEDIDYAGKRVVVIGSGATAVTLVPALARERRARHDAPALAQLRRVDSRRRPGRQGHTATAAHAPGLRGHALEERPHHDARLPAQPAHARVRQGAVAQGSGKTPPARL